MGPTSLFKNVNVGEAKKRRKKQAKKKGLSAATIKDSNSVSETSDVLRRSSRTRNQSRPTEDAESSGFTYSVVPNFLNDQTLELYKKKTNLVIETSAACMPSRRVPWRSKSQSVYPGGIHGLVLSLFAIIWQVACVQIERLA
jgi:hypothetical protein